MVDGEAAKDEELYEAIFYAHMFKLALDHNADLNERLRVFKILFNLVWAKNHRQKLIKKNHLKQLFDMGNKLTKTKDEKEENEIPESEVSTKPEETAKDP